MSLAEYRAKYGMFFKAVSEKTALHPDAAIEISYYIVRCDLDFFTKKNNFFAIADRANAKYRSYSTPFEGIQAGLALITGHSIWSEKKLGTLKANPALQTRRVMILMHFL